ncbi:MAG: ABC transporter ATP-binding protein [Pseudonocardia sp.]
MAEIVLDEVTKRFPDGTTAVQDVNLEINDGEFVILVGPSGCGKSTTLNMIAGLEEITSGELRIGGERVNERAPRDRNMAMVFQSYALYPHMTVRENMAFPLKLARVGRTVIEARVADTARMLDLDQLLDRKPATLSGGQRQRVAMGRAIVRSPQAYLMDEPLSNLDAKLRVQMRTSVARLQRRLGTTTVYVTHDQTEAMTLGDRAVVMRGGVVQQVGTPQLLYQRPANLFVAGFIGSPTMNFLPGHLADDLLYTALGRIRLPDRTRHALESAGAPRDVIMGLRPEHLEDASLAQTSGREHDATFSAQVDVLESTGSDKYAYFTVEGRRTRSAELAELAADVGNPQPGSSGRQQLVARLSADSTATEGETMRVCLDPDAIQVFDPDTGRNLTASSRPTVASDGPTPPGWSSGRSSSDRP